VNTAPLEISQEERLCVVCQEEIQTGEPVRPLPRCGHKFHAQCLERWALAMGESTRCPTCRRPALARKQGQGGTALSSLAPVEAESEDSAASFATGGRRLQRARARAARLALSRADALPSWAARVGLEESEDWDYDVETGVASRRIRRFHARSRRPLRSVSPRQGRTWEFEVTVVKNGEELGLDVLQQDWQTLLISRVKDGPLMEWNLSHPERSVCQGDRIIEVNGQRGNSEELIAAIRGGRSLHLMVRRLLEFCVTVWRPVGGAGSRLGLEVAQQARCLRILQVTDGLLRRWNAGVAFDLRVQAGDSVIEVDGIRGTSAELLWAIQRNEQEQLQLVVVRGRPPDLPPEQPQEPGGGQGSDAAAPW